MKINLLVEGGNMKPGPTLSQKLGPIGVNIGQVISKVNEATKGFAGMKVPVEVDVDPSSKEISVQVFSPPVSELLKRELGIEKGSGMQNKIKVQNISIEQIISIAKRKMPDLLCKDLKAAVKTVVGTCVSLGILVESKPAKEVEEEIEQGKYDKEINEERTEPSEEKKAKLQQHFTKIKEEQDKFLKSIKGSDEEGTSGNSSNKKGGSPAGSKK